MTVGHYCKQALRLRKESAGRYIETNRLINHDNNERIFHGVR